MLGRTVCCRPAAGLADGSPGAAGAAALPVALKPPSLLSASAALLPLREAPARPPKPADAASTRSWALLELSVLPGLTEARELPEGDAVPCDDDFLSSPRLEDAASGFLCFAELSIVGLALLICLPVSGDSEKSSTNPPLGTYRFSEVEAS